MGDTVVCGCAWGVKEACEIGVGGAVRQGDGLGWTVLVLGSCGQAGCWQVGNPSRVLYAVGCGDTGAMLLVEHHDVPDSGRDGT